jgi:hypothetical protein
MYIIYNAYDDNTADILDLNTLSLKFNTEIELIRLGNKEQVVGLTVDTHKIISLNSYSCLTFPTESEADEYVHSYLDKGNFKKIYINNMFYLLIQKEIPKLHVDYHIVTNSECMKVYVAKNKGYTPYIQCAKAFDKDTAKKQAALMQKQSKTGKYWTTERIVRATIN